MTDKMIMKDIKGRILDGGLYHFSKDASVNTLSGFIKFLKIIGIRGHLKFSYVGENQFVENDITSLEYIFCEFIEEVNKDEISKYLKMRNLFWLNSILSTHNELNKQIKDVSPSSYKLFTLLKSLLKDNDDILFIDNNTSCFEKKYEMELKPIILKLVQSTKTVIISGKIPESWNVMCELKIIKNQRNKYLLQSSDYESTLESVVETSDIKHAA